MINKLICFVIGSTLLLSCATIVRPSGGEKDSTPPALVMAKPASESLNFAKKSFELKFDEFIVSDDFASKILVSPSIETLQSKYTGKGLKMSWTEDLLPNTTYNFQFLNSIKDFNENNVLAGFQYTFSTGDILDTLAISGIVKNSTFDDVENVRICLIENEKFSDTSFVKSQYTYATFAQDNGEFVFNYLPNKAFRIYAFSDQNSNDVWDEEEDFIAFYPESISSIDSLSYHLELFKEDLDLKFIKVNHSAFNTLDLKYQKAIPEIETIKLINQEKIEDKSVWVFNNEVKMFFDEKEDGDSLTLLINEVDTLPFYKTQYRKIELDINPDFENLINKESAKFVVNYPLSAIDTSKIKTFIGIDSIIPTNISLQKDGHSILLDFPEMPEKLHVVFADSSLVYSDSIYNTEKKLMVSRTPIESLGSIQCTFQKHNYPLIVELFTTDNKIVKSKYLLENENKLEFNRLGAGNYKLRFIVDEDGDKRFTSGSVKKNLQPETIINYSSTITLKPNWITEIVF